MKYKDIPSNCSTILLSPRKYNSNMVLVELTVEMHSDKFGNLFYLVNYRKNDIELYVTFEMMLSVLDFINSNFE